MSKFAPLFDAIKKTNADELRLITGEKIHIVRKGARQDIGKEPLKPVNVDPLAAEVLSADDIRDLVHGPKTVRVDHQGTGFFLTVARSASGLTIAVALESAGPPAALSPLPPVRKEAAAGQAPPLLAAPPATLGIELDMSPAPAKPAAAAAAQGAGAAGAASPLDYMYPVRSNVTAGTVGEGSFEIEQLGRGANVKISGATSGSGNTGAIDEILRDMMSKKASDLHISAGSHPAMRVHGEMHFLTERPVLTSDDVMSLLRPIFTAKGTEDFEAKNDADFAYEVPGLARFRVNVFRDRKGVGAVLRQIPIEIISAEKLGLPKAVIDLCYLSKGLVVVTGPTGSGKSTTLAGMVDYINKNRNDHIITIEDPVEFVHQNIKCLVNQREVGQHTKSFKNALRAALREDPDIVLVGEMRDLETISIAMETAETGHLVFGTLHTTTAISTVDRIIDQFPTDQQPQVRVMLSESLRGVVAQVLCKKIGGGRVAALEILLVNNAVSSLIRDGKTFQIASVMQTSKGMGMITMNDSLMQLVLAKQVLPMDAYIKAVDKSGLLMMFKNAGIPSPI
jgi:twitching motility protein PilT